MQLDNTLVRRKDAGQDFDLFGGIGMLGQSLAR